MILGQGGKRDILLLFNPQVIPILTFKSGYDYFHVTKLFFSGTTSRDRRKQDRIRSTPEGKHLQDFMCHLFSFFVNQQLKI